MSGSELVLATGNAGKVAEISALLAEVSVTVVAQTALQVPEADETGTTFVENAVIKARNACAKTNRPALADDSGLVVPALAGAPGVYSARYAGNTASDEDNYRKLLGALAGDALMSREAYFCCVMVFMRSVADPTPLICQGQWHGHIAQAPSGDGGFGYDPVFVPEGEHRCAAQLTRDEKNAVSHRARALHALKPQLVSYFGDSD